MRIRSKLSTTERVMLSYCRIDWVSKWPRIHTHTMMMTKMIEQWNNDTYSFHLPIGEDFITSLDVWHILRVSIPSVIPKYQLESEEYYLCHMYQTDDLPMDQTHMVLEQAMEAC